LDQIPAHLALAYTAWAPVGPEGKLPEGERHEWLERLCDVPISPDYRVAFERWKGGFRKSNDRTLEFELASRLLVGHGNGSATDVGLTVHHTWGVPMIPGAAVKGLVSHYLSSVYGPEHPEVPPWEQEGVERDRARWQRGIWSRARRGPGEAYRALFGATNARDDGEMRERGFVAGAIAGSVTFYDALLVPNEDRRRVFAPDVLTVHQRHYYESKGESWPNDYDDPNPVGFLSVTPQVRMLFAFTAPIEALDVVERVLLEALETWGIGGKTSSGYGRLTKDRTKVPNAPMKGGASPSQSAAPKARHRRGEQIVVKRLADSAKTGKARFEADDGVLGYFQGSVPTIAVGESVEAWIWNTGQSYTLDARPLPTGSPKKGHKS
jgi:CRISPR-associated protein Cmr6